MGFRDLIAVRRRRSPRQLGLTANIAIIVVMLAAIAAAFWLFFGVAEIFSWTDDGDRVQYSLLIAGGIGAAAALVISFRKQRMAEGSVRGDEEVRFSQRFLEATGQLASDQPALRISGVYSLVRLGDEWISQRQMIVNVLTAYIRFPTQQVIEDGRTSENEIRAAIFFAIRDRLRAGAKVTWQGLTFDFHGAEMSDFDFSDVSIDASTLLDFGGAKFTHGDQTFSGSFAGSMSFAGAIFSGSRVALEGEFTGSKLDFSGCEIHAGGVSFSAILRNDEVNFSRTEIRGGHLSFSGSTFETKNVTFAGLFIPSGRFSFDHCWVLSGDLDFIKAQFHGSGADFSGTTFGGTNLLFSGARFKGRSSFESAQFVGARSSFEGAVFRAPSSFSGVVLAPSSTDFADCRYVEGFVEWGPVPISDFPTHGFSSDGELMDWEAKEAEGLSEYFRLLGNASSTG
jgi:uncharacterized protein YjbI with pentapeptide repeats